jgi:hypothetical protein
MFAGKADSHYKPFDGGRKRFYLDGRGYFAVGDKVAYPGVYSGVGRGSVAGAFYLDAGSGRVMYRIKFKLPKGHPDAADENGAPQFTKYAFIRDDELTRFNPEAA